MAMRLPASSSAIIAGRSTHVVYHLVDMPRTDTRQRILAAATDLFGGAVEAVSLDVIVVDVGVAEQTLLYWFPSKDELVGAVLADVAANSRW